MNCISVYLLHFFRSSLHRDKLGSTWSCARIWDLTGGHLKFSPDSQGVHDPAEGRSQWSLHWTVINGLPVRFSSVWTQFQCMTLRGTGRGPSTREASSPVLTAPKLHLTISQPNSGWAVKWQWYTGIITGILRETGLVYNLPRAVRPPLPKNVLKSLNRQNSLVCLKCLRFWALRWASLTCDKLFQFSEPLSSPSKKGQIILLISQGFWWRWNYIYNMSI